MERLTTDKPVREMSMTELAHNSCYRGEDGNARYQDYEKDLDARQFIIHLLKKYTGESVEFTSNEEFDEDMMEALAEGPATMRGVLAILYEQIWAKAELREYLRAYEETGLTVREALEIAKSRKADPQTGGDMEGTCPVCGNMFTYSGFSKPDDAGCTYPWSCSHCGATGQEAVNFVFDRHYNVLDKGGKPIPGRPE